MFFNLKDIYLKSWNVFAVNWWKFIVYSLILVLFVSFPFISIFQTLMVLLMFSAILKFLKESFISFSDFFNFKSVLNPTAVSVVVIIGFMQACLQIFDFPVIVYIILAILYLVLSIVLFPLFCVSIDKNLNLKEAILYSAKLTKGLRIELLIITIINLFLGIIGLLFFFLGIFITLPIVLIVNVLAYIEMEKKFSN